jgi:hypothetical protein
MITGPTGLITATCSVWRRPSGLRQKAPTIPAGSEALSGAVCALCRPVGLSNQVKGGAGWGGRIPSSSKKRINFPLSRGTLGQSSGHSGWFGCRLDDADRAWPRLTAIRERSAARPPTLPFIPSHLLRCGIPFAAAVLLGHLAPVGSVTVVEQLHLVRLYDVSQPSKDTLIEVLRSLQQFPMFVVQPIAVPQLVVRVCNRVAQGLVEIGR